MRGTADIIFLVIGGSAAGKRYDSTTSAGSPAGHNKLARSPWTVGRSSTMTAMETVKLLNGLATRLAAKYELEEVVGRRLLYLREHTVLSCIVVLGVYSILSWLSALRKEVKVPRVYVSSSTFLQRWTDPFRLLFRSTEAAFQGYQKFPKSFFKVKFLNQTLVVVDRDHLKELFDAPEDVLSFGHSVSEFLQRKYTMQDPVMRTYAVDVVKEKLSRNIPTLMDDIVDEVQCGIADQIPLTDDWTPVVAYEKSMNVIARISNRIFVGLPLCRNEDYLRIAVGHSNTVLKAAILLRFFPVFLRRFIVLFFVTLRRDRKAFHKFIGSVVNERRASAEKLGSDYKKPNDLLQWLMDAAKGSDASTEQLALRTLVLNFASIHTTSVTFTNALYELAAHPECADPLREEIESIVSKEGWTKMSIMKMRKLDSLVKESIRLHALSNYSSRRIAVKPFTFSNGVYISPGTAVASPLMPIHMDETIYSDPWTFDPFRFSRKRELEGESAKHHAANTSLEYLYFGYGHHACPGRFFAINEIKLMLAFTLLKYDVRTEEGSRPKEWVFNSMIVLDRKAKILYRRRQ